MNRPLIYSSAFQRHLKRILKKNPEYQQTIQFVLATLSENAHDPSLYTHKLKGNLKGNWSCTVGYDLRIIFEFFDLMEKSTLTCSPSALTTKSTK